MSLAICVVQDEFIIASSDSAITYFPSEDSVIFNDNGKENETDGPLATDGKSEKVHKMTDTVLLSSCGNLYLVEAFQVELKSRLEDSYDLSKCRIIAKETMADFLNGRFYNKETILLNLKESLQIPDDVFDDIKELLYEYILSLLPHSNEINDLVNDFTAYLIGYDNNGKSGMVDLRNNTYITPNKETGGYPVLIDGGELGNREDHIKTTEYQPILNIPIELRTLENFLNAILFVHTAISARSPINVSPDCNLHFLIKENDRIFYHKDTVDTQKLRNELLK